MNGHHVGNIHSILLCGLNFKLLSVFELALYFMSRHLSSVLSTTDIDLLHIPEDWYLIDCRLRGIISRPTSNSKSHCLAVY